jgi:hypothetical protein
MEFQMGNVSRSTAYNVWLEILKRATSLGAGGSKMLKLILVKDVGFSQSLMLSKKYLFNRERSNTRVEKITKQTVL